MTENVYTCINCPMGCKIRVRLTPDNKILDINGNSCNRGKEYVTQEVVCPMRILTSTMKAADHGIPFSVKSSKAIPKFLLIECAREIKKHHPRRPIHAGDIVIPNILGTEADIVATSTLL